MAADAAEALACGYPEASKLMREVHLATEIAKSLESFIPEGRLIQAGACNYSCSVYLDYFLFNLDLDVVIPSNTLP